MAGLARVLRRGTVALLVAAAAAVALPAGPVADGVADMTRPALAPSPSVHPLDVARTEAARLAAAPPTRAAPKTIRPPRRSGEGRRVVYSVSRQRVWLVTADGRVDRSYLVSGRPSQPGPGTFRVFSRSRWTSSSVSAETMEYMVRFTFGVRTGAPIGFHTIPVDYAGRPAQTVDQLGEALSAGCIRQRRSDAVALWRFADVGTRVVVIP
ncbi:MAG: L,D-transpeptidase [Actinomycetes bacterium]